MEGVIWSDETKIELFGRNAAHRVWGTKMTAFERKNTITTVKHGGGSIMVWACCTSHGTGALGIIVGIIDGRKKHSLLFEIFSDKGSGTLIRK